MEATKGYIGSRNAIRGSRVRNGAEVLLSLDDIHTQFGEFPNE